MSIHLLPLTAEPTQSSSEGVSEDGNEPIDESSSLFPPISMNPALKLQPRSNVSRPSRHHAQNFLMKEYLGYPYKGGMGSDLLTLLDIAHIQMWKPQLPKKKHQIFSYSTVHPTVDDWSVSGSERVMFHIQLRPTLLSRILKVDQSFHDWRDKLNNTIFKQVKTEFTELRKGWISPSNIESTHTSVVTPQNNPNHPLLICPLAVLPSERHPKDGTTDAQNGRSGERAKGCREARQGQRAIHSHRCSTPCATHEHSHKPVLSLQRLPQLNRVARVPVAPLIVLVAVSLSVFQGTHSTEAASPQHAVTADHHQDSLAGV
ncbi:hypothetical protein BLNAU_18777 [Blattamonas nauphoetae]|uniref:Uncharacterized protein n=1 Tax=Blattamonas nauphoetae TaxID=2049346 RepID=A0ABQ9X6K9_9EUKA|nr:hypothetical protein BLNAU_18777 [Blattamonas nauphoetae]